jgi:hypothetical protein
MMVKWGMPRFWYDRIKNVAKALGAKTESPGTTGVAYARLLTG